MRTQRTVLTGGNPGAPVSAVITNADYVSSAFGLEQDYGCAIQAIWTGAAIAGTIKLQATIDDVTWSDIVDSSETVSGPNSFIWNLNGTFYNQIRAYFTYGSGSGTLQLWAQNKGP